MTVGDLRKVLSKADKDAEVVIEAYLGDGVHQLRFARSTSMRPILWRTRQDHGEPYPSIKSCCSEHSVPIEAVVIGG